MGTVGEPDGFYQTLADGERLELQAEATRSGDLALLLPQLERLSALTDGITVLDAGCGDGVATWDRFRRADNVSRVVGVDTNEGAISVARARTAQDDRFEFVAGDVDALDGTSGPFHLVFTAFVLAHLRDPGGTIRRLWNLLSPGGSLIVRDVEAALELTYPPSEDMDFLVRTLERLRRTSDRTVGRRLYGMFANLDPPPASINIRPDALVLASRDRDVRGRFFDVHHGSKAMPAKQASIDEGGAGPSTDLYQKMLRALDKERGRFVETEELFAVHTQITGCAVKP